MTPLVGVDTMVLVHASRRSQEGDQTLQLELRKRTLYLIKHLSQNGSKIIVPTVALSEFLVGIEPKNRGKVTQAILSHCMVKPLDIPSADLAASLWAKHKDLPPDHRLQRNVFKIDVLVVASAKIAGASVFYSHDAKCRKLAELADMEAKNLPVQAGDLLADLEIREGEIETGLEED